ncbi:nucleotidyltransferase family protein [Porticoccaceae bacterium]|jgi:MurNAc alpha-1-phosphate uridylyltransferase|nr:nucleotidyltransferase family protein [Porticoccaceae bacterium]MDC0054093.1 nucleotidyltransferase family protein [Gammaproteobacteria bacterium]MDA9583320.1 nucleotidyltransferase family protein [Porticoccaceae bacterium]MDB2400816.1 nucleotidyltransferase family protein [Porticoccaceae bacterium]MDB2558101.1 nucleotidyltransferase family protein [Porticoccaceae bacterium]
MKAMILAAGLGSRLQPLTKTVPKPMLLVCGKPLLQWHIERLVRAGVREVVVNTSWLGEQIQDYFGTGVDFGITITWSSEAEPLETGGGIFKALHLFGDDPFILMSADIWTDFPLESFLKKNIDSPLSAHLVLVKNPEHNNGGDFSLENYIVGYGQERYTYSGISIVSSQLFNSLKITSDVFPLREVLKPAISSGRVSGEIYTGDWCDVGTIGRYNNLNKRLLETTNGI